MIPPVPVPVPRGAVPVPRGAVPLGAVPLGGGGNTPVEIGGGTDCGTDGLDAGTEGLDAGQ